ncbi:hypothetical protein [Mycolicibacterium lutetiense]
MPDDATADHAQAEPSENKLLLYGATVFARLALAAGFETPISASVFTAAAAALLLGLAPDGSHALRVRAFAPVRDCA